MVIPHYLQECLGLSQALRGSSILCAQTDIQETVAPLISLRETRERHGNSTGTCIPTLHRLFCTEAENLNYSIPKPDSKDSSVESRTDCTEARVQVLGCHQQELGNSGGR